MLVLVSILSLLVVPIYYLLLILVYAGSRIIVLDISYLYRPNISAPLLSRELTRLIPQMPQVLKVLPPVPPSISIVGASAPLGEFSLA